jgi:glycosyltransferase involved in cell wall biosynthesis
MTSDEVRPFWLVVDIRSASTHSHSGVARFVIGLSRALSEALSIRRSHNDAATGHVRVLLVSKAEPPRWAIELIQENPTLVSFWSGGPGALSQKWEKPQYLWSSRVLKWILKWSRGQFYWIAPGNFDRPVMTGFLLPRAMRSRIVQVIHDTIPIEHARSMSLLFRVQFSLIVRRTLAKLPYVFTVSKDSAERLERLAPRRSQPVYILPSGIESIFGSLPRYRSLAELISARRTFLDILFAGNKGLASAGSESQGNSLKTDELDQLVRRRWIVGVGRSQKYKGWELAEDVVHQLHSDLSEGVVFLRVGGDEDGASKTTKAGGKPSAGVVGTEHSSGLRVTRSENGIMVHIESLPDEMLAQLYRCGDVLVHPSQAEGFGFPPVEAALSGLPVVFRAGTAVDGHFNGHSFHPHFWQGIDSDESSVWREALLAVLRNKSGLDVFMNEMQAAVHPRSFICQRGGGQDFRWLRAADSLLSTLFSEAPKNSAEVTE